MTAGLTPAPIPPADPPALPVHRKAKGPARSGKPRGNRRPVAERFRMINEFIDRTMGDLTPGETAVWLILWRDTKGGIAKTSLSRLAVRAGMHKRSVERSLERLIGKGLVRIVCKGGIRTGSSEYKISPIANNK